MNRIQMLLIRVRLRREYNEMLRTAKKVADSLGEKRAEEATLRADTWDRTALWGEVCPNQSEIVILKSGETKPSRSAFALQGLKVSMMIGPKPSA